MSEGGAWRGDIRARLYERARERGYDSLTAFAEARPAVPIGTYQGVCHHSTSCGRSRNGGTGFKWLKDNSAGEPIIVEEEAPCPRGTP